MIVATPELLEPSTATCCENPLLAAVWLAAGRLGCGIEAGGPDCGMAVEGFVGGMAVGISVDGRVVGGTCPRAVAG